MYKNVQSRNLDKTLSLSFHYDLPATLTNPTYFFQHFYCYYLLFEKLIILNSLSTVLLLLTLQCE